MDTLWQDIRYAFRTLAQKPGFTAVAVLTLALGIGANTAIFSVVNAVLLRPLPFKQPERLVRLWNQLKADGLPQMWLSEPELIDYRERQQPFTDIAVFSTTGANLTGAGEPQRVTVSLVSAPFFPVLGTDALLGRTFTPEEDTPGKNQVVVLSYGFWQRQFGGAQDIVGRTLNLNDEPSVVVGVMPSSFAYPPDDVQLWRPLAIDTAKPDDRGSHYLEAIARLKDGVSFEQAQAATHTLAQQVAHDHADYYGTDRGWDAYLIPLLDSYVGQVRPALLVLLAAVGFVLLIACANLANLLLARAAAREKEIAIRAALGAGRLRIARQLLTESALLACVGGGAGLLLAWGGLRLLHSLAPDNLPRLEEIGLDPTVLAFTVGLSLLTGLLFGLAPAWHAVRAQLNESLKEGGRGAAAAGSSRVRRLLVVAEVGLSLVLLIGAGLTLKSFAGMLSLDPGYRTDNILSFRLALPTSRYAEKPQVVGFYQELLGRLRALPGVESASAINLLPLSGLYSSGTVSVETPGPSVATPPEPGDDPYPGIETDYRVVAPDYFETMGMTLVRGRFLAESDNADAPAAVVVDEDFARRFWGDADPLGQRLTVGGGMHPSWHTVVGLVKHIRHYGLETEGREQIYLPHAQSVFTPRSMHVVVRTAGDPGALAGAARQQVQALDPQQPIYDMRTMDERLRLSLAQARFNLLLLMLFAGVALAMAAVGLYGVMAYTVTQRTHEFGVRMALGAAPRDIFRLVASEGMLLALAGIGLGLAAAVALTRLIASLLLNVSTTDPVTFSAVAVVLAAVALLACWLPARRATRVDPLVALRYE